jgi:hypothetical protein
LCLHPAAFYFGFGPLALAAAVDQWVLAKGPVVVLSQFCIVLLGQKRQPRPRTLCWAELLRKSNDDIYQVRGLPGSV